MSLLWSIDSNHGHSHGFLPCTPPLQRLSHSIFNELEDFVSVLPAHISSGAIQQLIQKLPLVDEPLLSATLTTEAEKERAMLLYSMLGHAYINGAYGGKQHLLCALLQSTTSSTTSSVIHTNCIPRNIAVPWSWLSVQLSRPPILSYASIVLYNWKLLDEEKEIDLDNITILNRFLGLVDEEWFFKIHVVIEYKARRLVSATKKIVEIIRSFYEMTEEEKEKEEMKKKKKKVKEDEQQLQRQQQQKLSDIHEEMIAMIASLRDVTKTLHLLPQRCDPYIFYNSLRCFLASFADGPGRKDGLIFQGTNNTCPMKYTGASGAQSSILPMLDTFLGIEHKNDTLSQIISELRAYMPPPHRSFLSSITPGVLRSFIESQRNHFPSLVSTYDGILEEMVRFRKIHLEYAAKYIVRQVNKTPDSSSPTSASVAVAPSQRKLEVTGTGGTPFMKYLTEHLKETKRRQFGFKYSQTARVIGLLKDVHGLLPEWLRGPEARVMDLEPQFQAERKAKVVITLFVLCCIVLVMVIVVGHLE